MPRWWHADSSGRRRDHIKSSREISSIACETGTVVPAQPGFELLGLHKEKNEICRDPIIAWRFADDDQPIALTPAISCKLRYPAGVGVLYPDGQVYDPYLERSYSDSKAWILGVRKWEEEQKRYIEKRNAQKQADTSCQHV
jgi:hypothetical protein